MRLATCPICDEGGGFHDEGIHAGRPLPEDKVLPLLDVSSPCRACGEPVDGPGAPGCRYPNHKNLS